MENEYSNLKLSLHNHIKEVLKLFNDNSLVNDFVEDHICYLNDQFINKTLMPLFGSISEADLTSNLLQICEFLTEQHLETRIYTMIQRKSKSVNSFDIDHYLFLIRKGSKISYYRSSLPKIIKLIRALQNLPSDPVQALLTVIGVIEINSYVDNLHPYIAELISKGLGENLTQGLNLSENSVLCRESIIKYLLEKEGTDLIYKFARGEGLELRVRQRYKENGFWDWTEDYDYVRFHLFSNLGNLIPGLNEEFENERKKVIDSLRDLLPEKY